MLEPRSFIGAWREMRTVWASRKDEPDYEFDTPVTARAEGAPEAQEPEAASVGDIAPRGLRAEV